MRRWEINTWTGSTHYKKQINVPPPKTDEHMFMGEEHTLYSLVP
jgi:hypothetical protein